MNSYKPDVYTPELLQTWIQIAERQAPKDRLLIPPIARQFGPGPVLELGSGTGHLTQLLRSLGHEVVPSDYAQFFVDYMKSKGLNARRIDATAIGADDYGFPNIFCQSITPFITTELVVIDKAYRSVLKALAPGGRFVLIHAMAKRADLRQTMVDHEALANDAGFRDVTLRRDQLLPTAAYAKAPWLANTLDGAFAPILGSRFVLSATRPK